MNDSQTTRSTLLLRLKNGQDESAWSEFVEIYTPIVYGFLRHRGLQDADSADVTQEVFRTVARSLSRFDLDRRKGTFRGWLFAIVRSRFHDFITARQQRIQGSGSTDVHDLLDQQPASDSSDELWDREYQRGVFQWAVRKVRPDCEDATWQAFWRMAVLGQPARVVAESLGITSDAAYVAKCRVRMRIKRAIQLITNEHEELQDDREDPLS